jgi:ubiquinone/menaquinone biosynthesis C-methylase UbiE
MINFEKKPSKFLIILFYFFIFFLRTYFCAYAEETNRFRFAVMGCMHLGVCDYRDFESAAEKMKEYNPDFVLFLGGMIDPSGEQSVESSWHKYDSIVGKLGIPVYDVPSNCRLTGLSVSQDRVALMERCFLDRYKRHYYSFEHKNNLFIGLDLGYHLDQTKDSDFINQLDFLKKTIADVSRYDNVFIFTHCSPWFKAHSEWPDIIHPLIQGKVKFVFGAEKHYIDAKVFDDVTYITTGSPPCYLRVYTSELSFFNFLIVEVNGDNVSIQVVPMKTFPIENLGTISGVEQASVDSLHSVAKPYLLTAHEREAFLQPDRVIEALKIKPGMDILDIGAGAGFFTFRFADALKGTGRVFATETDPNMVAYIKDKIEEGGYKNIFPILVKREGLDRFYKRRSFDLILMSEAYQYLRSPEDYFRELRLSLKKGGRIYIIHPKNVYDFTEIEVNDFKYLIKILILNGKNYPVFRKLDEDIQYFIKNWRGQDVPHEVRAKIIKNLNRMLQDRWLLYDLMDYFANEGKFAVEGEWSSPLDLFVYERNIPLVRWLFVYLEAQGVFDESEKNLTAKNKEQLCKLNKILLCDIFGIDKLRSLQADFDPVFFAEKNSVISKMEKAGYRFVGEYNFLPLHHFLEFQRND